MSPLEKLLEERVALMAKLFIEDLDVRGKKVLMRVDFNVPLDEKGKVSNDARIKAALPSINYVLDNGGALILMSHLGRPKGKAVDLLKMDPVAGRLSELLGRRVKKLDDCVGPEAAKAAGEMKPGDIILLENLRFHKEETSDDEKFAEELAALADLYVNDAFGTVHRAHASVSAVAKKFDAACGYLLRKEIEYFEKLLKNPERPFVSVLGGAKVSDKIPVIENLIKITDRILIGGGMAYTFLKAQEHEIGKSKLEEEMLDTAACLIKKAEAAGVSLLLPVDHVVAEKFDGAAEKRTVKEIPAGWLALDIGPETVKLFCDNLRDAKTVFWNGPVGVFEMKPFAEGTFAIARLLAELDAATVIGGGDTVSAVDEAGVSAKMSHISTGGGAALEFMEGKELPGVAALKDRAG